jgi:hypothetical protein
MISSNKPEYEVINVLAMHVDRIRTWIHLVWRSSRVPAPSITKTPSLSLNLSFRYRELHLLLLYIRPPDVGPA